MRIAFGAGVSLVALAVSQLIYAQEPEAAGPADAAAAAESGAAGAEAESQVAEITITGTRIARRDYTSASPIVTTSQQALQDTGQINIHESLAQLPQFNPGQPAGRNAGGAGRNTIDLRGLGASRTLVLLDGRRLPPSNLFGVVDTNIIPQALIESVETISGGASAVYGSDAIAGVVNFRTRSRVDGIEVGGQYGNTTRGDRWTADSWVAAGLSTDDGRGSGVVTFTYSGVGELPSVKRRFYDLGTLSSYIAQGTFIPDGNNLPSQAAVDAAFPDVAAGTVPNTRALGFNDDGTLFSQIGAVNYKGPTDGYWSLLGNTVRMPVARQGTISTPRDRFAAFSKFEYEVNDYVTAYTHILAVDSELDSAGGYSLTQFAVPTVSINNPFIPQSLRDILASRPDPDADFTINRRFWELPRRETDTQFWTSQLILGVRGKLPFGDWTYDAYAARDKTTVDQQVLVVLASQLEKVFQAPDGGASLCEGGYNPFGMQNAMSVSEDCIDFLTDRIHNEELIRQDNYELSAQGSLFALPAGDLRMSVVASHRRNSFRFSPDSQLIAGNVEAIVATNPTEGATSVDELATEVLVPILRDARFARTLELTAGARYSDYDLSGGVWTYKGELEWAPVRAVLLRGGYQRAIRAPNIGELFSSPTGGQVEAGNPPAGGDPCDIRNSGRSGANAAQLRDLCVATGVPGSLIDTFTYSTTGIAIEQSGNLALDPETATTKTFGVVFRPAFSSPYLIGLSASIDYFDIEVDDVISTIAGTTVMAKCYNQDGSNPTYSADNEYCQLIARDASNGWIRRIALPYLNLGGLKTRGVDFQLDWEFDLAELGLAEAGTLSFRNLVTYLDSYQRKALPDSEFQEFAGTIDAAEQLALPEWRWISTTTYSRGPFSASLRWRHVDAMKDVTSVTRPANPAPGVSSYDLFDLTARVTITDDTALRFGLTNIFDKEPLKVAGVEGSTLPGTYDIFGRLYYLGLQVKF